MAGRAAETAQAAEKEAVDEPVEPAPTPAPPASAPSLESPLHVDPAVLAALAEGLTAQGKRVKAQDMVKDAKRQARNGDVEGARTLLKQAAALDPAGGSAPALLARILVKQGLFAEAVPWAREASRRRPTRPNLHLLLGDCLGRVGARTGAREAYQRALELRPDDPGARRRIAALDAAGG